MYGVISAGSTPTAETGAKILANGGNAIDAAVGACFAVAAGEPTLTSLAGGGMMMVHSARTGQTIVHDFFGNAPRLAQGEVPHLDFYPIKLDYGPTTQKFYVGQGAAGVPGVIPGLCLALERWGTQPLSEVIKPACALLRNGAVIGAGQAALAQFLKPILTETAASRAIFAPEGDYLDIGTRFRLPVLADTLEDMADQGWKTFYGGHFRNLILDQFGPDNGGLLTAEDLNDYAVIERLPLVLDAGGGQLHTIPLPAAGGPMIGLMRQLFKLDASAAATRERRLCAAMATADCARLHGRLKNDDTDREWCRRDYLERVTGSVQGPSQSGGPSCTTHISVVDAAGNAVGVTFSHGESNGRPIGNTGIMMNNFLGEEDLLPKGLGTATPGQRLATMMSPTIVSADDGSMFVMGTGGSNRIRTAILQVLGRILDEDMAPADAVKAPRLHYESGVLNAEIFDESQRARFDGIDTKAFVPFNKPHMFFGGVNCAARMANGDLTGGADSRRGGHCIVV
ncbi:MAG: gamma-glutamyltransferase [Myxococcota bacterium]|nr:gamma-glutamyltransferase [Myxococcota bacterium]